MATHFKLIGIGEQLARGRGEMGRSRLFRKSVTRSAGAAYVPPAAANAAASTRRCSSRPRSSSGPPIASKSSSFVWTTIPAFAYPDERL